MADLGDRLAKEMEELKGVRDELRLQLHLAKADARDRWEALEKRWQHLEGKLKVLRSGGREAADDIGEAARLLVDEIRSGYRNLRELL